MNASTIALHAPATPVYTCVTVALIMANAAHFSNERDAWIHAAGCAGRRTVMQITEGPLKTRFIVTKLTNVGHMEQARVATQVR